MKRIFKQFRKKIIPNLFLLLLTIQNLFPLSILFSSSAQAQLHLDPQVVSVDFDTSTYELSLRVAEPLVLDYLVEYQDGEGVIQAVQGKTELETGGTIAEVYLGVCSATDCIPADFETGKLIFPNTDYQADFVYQNGNFWLVENSLATIEKVELDKVYTAPQNGQVQVTFTELPANPGTLSIQEVYLTEEQMAVSGAVSKVAYDITSDMENGTFKYELKLPVPDSNTGEVQIKYAESVEELAQAVEVVVEKNGNEVVAKELNHFTVFVVTSFEEVQTTPTTDGYNDIWYVWGDPGAEMIRVPSGTDGIVSSEGNYHAIINDGAFTRWDGYRSTFPADGYNTSVDVYLDMSLADGSVDKRFDFSSAINKPDGNHRRDFILSLGTNPSIHNQWLASASNNSPGWPGNPGRNPVDIVETGWYTIKHEFRANSSNVLEVTISLYKKGESTPVGIWVLSDSSDVIGNTVGGNRYGWFIWSDKSPDSLLVDNTKIEIIDPIIKDIHFNTGTPVIGGSTSNINLEVQATYPTYGVDRVRFRYAPPGETCKAQYTSPYFNNIGDGTKNGDLYSIDWDVTGLPSGEYTACALMHRGSGASSEGYKDENHAEFKVVIDNTKPSAPTIIFPAESQNFVSTPILNDWTDVNDDSGIDYYRVEYKYDDGHTFSGFPYRETTVSQRNHIPNNSEQGGVSFRVQAFDGLGNEGDWSEWRHYYFDKEAPTTPTNLRRYIKGTTTELACGNVTQRQTLIPIWDANTESDFDHYEYSSFNPGGSQGINEEILYTNEKMHSWTPPTDGTYGFAVRAVDKAGNKSAWSLSGESLVGSCQITYDSIAPDVEITSPAAGLVTGIVDIRGSVEDTNPHHYWFVIQNSSGTTIAGPGVVNDTSSFTDELLLSWDVSSLPDGEYTIKLEARDAANNKDGGSVHWVKVLVDNTKPSSTITSYGLGNGGEVETNTFDGLIEGIATDIGSGVDHVLLSVGYYSFGDGPAGQKYWDKDAATWVVGEVLFQANGADTWSYQLPDVPEGVYTITSHAVDVAGNQEATFVITIVYDKTIPEVTLTIDPTSPDGDNGWYKTLPTITLTATDNYQTEKIEYHWNSDGWSTYTNSLTPPSEGQNIIYYRGVDKVGNTTAVGVKEVKYDATAPVDGPLNVKVENITLDSAIGKWEAPTTNSDITRYVLSWKHESGDSNGIEVGSDIFEHEMKSLYNGEWTFIVKAMDDAGNFKESAVKFRIGPPVGGTSSISEGTVLGVIDETGETTRPTSQVAGVVTTVDEASEKTEEQTTDNNEEGQVLGETKEQCTGVTSNLPWLLLVIQFALMGLAELLFKNADKKIKKTIFWGLALLMPVVFYLSRNEACYSTFVYNWFVLPSLGTTVLARLVSYFFIEEIA